MRFRGLLKKLTVVGVAVGGGGVIYFKARSGKVCIELDSNELFRQKKTRSHLRSSA